MDNVLQTALAEAVNSLANFFGTTTEEIMVHAPEFLAKYGWYDMLTGLPGTILLCLLFAVLVYVILCMVRGQNCDYPGWTCIGIILVCLVGGVGIQVLTCMIAPEIVGAHAILELLKTMGSYYGK